MDRYTLGICICFPYLKLKALMAKLLNIIFRWVFSPLFAYQCTCCALHYHLKICFLSCSVSLCVCMCESHVCYILVSFFYLLFSVYQMQTWHLKSSPTIVTWMLFIPHTLSLCVCIQIIIILSHDTSKTWVCDYMQELSLFKTLKISLIPMDFSC